jgi:hypothetical protein
LRGGSAGGIRWPSRSITNSGRKVFGSTDTAPLLLPLLPLLPLPLLPLLLLLLIIGGKCRPATLDAGGLHPSPDQNIISASCIE